MQAADEHVLNEVAITGNDSFQNNLSSKEMHF